jgi:hypothetical protein
MVVKYYLIGRSHFTLGYVLSFPLNEAYHLYKHVPYSYFQLYSIKIHEWYCAIVKHGEQQPNIIMFMLFHQYQPKPKSNNIIFVWQPSTILARCSYSKDYSRIWSQPLIVRSSKLPPIQQSIELTLLRMMARASWVWYVVCVAGFAGLRPSQSAKLPSWRGPDTFFDGTLPPARQKHGFASCDDGKVYVFGGDDQNGGAPCALPRLP